MQRPFTILLTFILCAATPSACVYSDLSNAFDPTTLPGLFIGITLATDGTASVSNPTSVDPAVSVCTDVTPTIVEFSTVGTTSYTVPATARYVHIRVIGGGGGGGRSNGDCTTLGFPATNGGDSSVSLQGAGTNLLTATGGSAGTCGDFVTQGLGGTGGTPGGVAGTDGTQTLIPLIRPGGSVASHWGEGGGGFQGLPGRWGGGSGGSGGLAESTFTDLASETLDITIGAGGNSNSYTGTQGYVQITLF